MVKVRYELDDDERQALVEMHRTGAIDTGSFDGQGRFVRRVSKAKEEAIFALVDEGLAKLVGALERYRTGRRGYELTPRGTALAEELEDADTNPGVT